MTALLNIFNMHICTYIYKYVLKIGYIYESALGIYNNRITVKILFICIIKQKTSTNDNKRKSLQKLAFA